MSMVPLSELVETLESGARPKGGIKDGQGDVPSLGAEHLADDGGFNFEKDKRIPLDFYKSLKQGRIRPNDILIVKDGATTGKVSFVNGDFPFAHAAVSEHVFRLVVDTKKADPEFVFRYLQSSRGQAEILRDFRGATVGGIGRTFIDKVLLPAISPTEQRRVVMILNKADGIRRKREHVLRLVDTFCMSAFLEMFGDTASDRSGLHSTTPLGKLVDERGISYGIVQRGAEEKAGIPIVRISNIASNRFNADEIVRTSKAISDKYKRTILKGGELLLSIRGTVGRVAITPVEAAGFNVSREIAVIPLLPGINPLFVQAVMLTPGAQRFMTENVKGVAQRGINLEDVRELPIPRVTSKALERFLDIVVIANRIRSRLEEPDQLFDSLSVRAFRGEL